MTSDFNNTPNSGGLDDVVGVGSTSERSAIVQIAQNMGNRTFLLYMPMKEFFSQSIVANESIDGSPVTQRKLDESHAKALAKYLLKGLIVTAKASSTSEQITDTLDKLLDLLGKQAYVSIQPIVCNLRDVGARGSKLRADRLIDRDSGITVGFKVYLPQEALFHVVDGQHRRFAIELLLKFLNQSIQTRKLSKKTDNLILPLSGDVESPLLAALHEILNVASTTSTVQVESHLGLNIEEERQLFHDLNNLGKNVDANLALQFDSANPVNAYIKEALIDDDSLLSWDVVEENLEWSDDLGAISRKDLTSINARLFLNQTNINKATTYKSKVNDMKSVADRFWCAVNKLDFLGEAGSKQVTVAAQPIFLKALAKLTYDFSNGTYKKTNSIDIFFDELGKLDTSHQNPVWRYFLLTEEERVNLELTSLADYFPEDIETKSKVKTFCIYNEDQNIIKFGGNHNDIYPILVEMIRYSMGLTPKKRKTLKTVDINQDLFIGNQG